MLTKVRTYADLWYSDWLRVYGEFVWADSIDEDLPAPPFFEDRGDILDLFADVKLFELHDSPVYVRGGYQELLYGSQRLVTALAWASKRNTYLGAKVFRQGKKWDFDAFWVQPVPAKASEFNTPDENRNFVGTWLTYRPKQGDAVDFYYLMLDDSNELAQGGLVRSPFQRHTIGSRWVGKNGNCLFDFEGAFQFGEQGGNDLSAGMVTAGIGHNWIDAPLNPTLWLYYDYASGDSDPTAGPAHTFNSLFPFSHFYLGWMDLVGRQNIHDLNAQLWLYPAPWLTVWLGYHHFWLDQSRDALYNPIGIPLRRDPTGRAGSNVGDEIDIVLLFHLARHSDILVSYNKLFGGSYLEATSGPNRATDAESLYVMFQQRW